MGDGSSTRKMRQRRGKNTKKMRERRVREQKAAERASK